MKIRKVTSKKHKGAIFLVAGKDQFLCKIYPQRNAKRIAGLIADTLHNRCLECGIQDETIDGHCPHCESIKKDI